MAGKNIWLIIIGICNDKDVCGMSSGADVMSGAVTQAQNPLGTGCLQLQGRFSPARPLPRFNPSGAEPTTRRGLPSPRWRHTRPVGLQLQFLERSVNGGQNQLSISGFADQLELLTPHRLRPCSATKWVEQRRYTQRLADEVFTPHLLGGLICPLRNSSARRLNGVFVGVLHHGSTTRSSNSKGGQRTRRSPAACLACVLNMSLRRPTTPPWLAPVAQLKNPT